MQQWYDEPPQPIQEVIARCDKDYCYRSCRLALLGGGRCTKAGCMCYHSYFDHDGKPLAYRFPEDYIWHSLKDNQQRAILGAMREGIPRRPPPTQPPKLPPLPTTGFKKRGPSVDPRNPDRPSPMFDGEDSYDPFAQPEAEEDPFGIDVGPVEAEEEKRRGPQAEEEEDDNAGGGGWWVEPEQTTTTTTTTAAPAPFDEEDDDNPFAFGDDNDFF